MSHMSHRGFGGSQFRRGTFAFQIGREISHFQFETRNFPRKVQGPLRNWHPRLSSTAPGKPDTPQHFWECPRKFPAQSPGAYAKFPAAKFATANLTWHDPPPPPPVSFGGRGGQIVVTRLRPASPCLGLWVSPPPLDRRGPPPASGRRARCEVARPRDAAAEVARRPFGLRSLNDDAFELWDAPAPKGPASQLPVKRRW